MHIDPYIVLGAAIVGVLVGMTGAGGGALMTPMLILLFGVKPSSAITSDLVAAVVMRPIGAAVHLRAGTVNLDLVKWLTLGSVPAAFLGAYLLHVIGSQGSAQDHIETVLGTALLIGSAAMVLRAVIDRRAGNDRAGQVAGIEPRRLATVALGVLGGVIVGMTSVGSGSLMVVIMLFIYPTIGANQLVGTDLTQAVPLTAAAALGALVFGHVEFGVTTSLIIGSVPAVLIGSLLSSSVPDRFVRPVITFVIFASGLMYVGLSTAALGWSLCATLFLAAAVWLAIAHPWEQLSRPVPAGAAEIQSPAAGDEPRRQSAPNPRVSRTIGAGAGPLGQMVMCANRLCGVNECGRGGLVVAGTRAGAEAIETSLRRHDGARDRHLMADRGLAVVR